MNHNFAGISFGYDADKIFKERSDTMCTRWRCSEAKYTDCTVKVNYNNNGNFIIKGNARGEAAFVKFWASTPPTYSQSFAGSGLPYPNQAVAFENSPNQGVSEVKGGKFQFTLEYPNSYYDEMLRKYVPPQAKFVFCDSHGKNVGDVHVVNLGNGIPFRTLVETKKRNWNNGPLFYCNNNLPVRNQEQILRSSAYPPTNEEPANFWGLMPPH